MSEDKKKSLFDKAIDALTDRDEKEAAAKAAADKESAKKAAAAKASADNAVAEREAAAKQLAEKLAAEEAATEKADAEKAAALRSVQRGAAERAAAAAPKRGIVTVRSLRIRADHNTSSEVVGGLVDGNEVTILDTWSDGKDTWAKLDKGWAAMVYDGETYIKLVQ